MLIKGISACNYTSNRASNCRVSLSAGLLCLFFFRLLAFGIQLAVFPFLTVHFCEVFVITRRPTNKMLMRGPRLRLRLAGNSPAATTAPIRSPHPQTRPQPRPQLQLQLQLQLWPDKPSWLSNTHSTDDCGPEALPGCTHSFFFAFAFCFFYFYFSGGTARFYDLHGKSII